MKKYFCGIILLILIITMQLQVDACTIFNKHDNREILVGNNEDWTYSIPSMMWIVASGDKTYGRVCFANSYYVQGGMNEKGLFYDGATCPSSKVPVFDNKPQLGMDFGEIIISKCANVEEAVKMIKEFNIPSDFSDHIMLADQSGDSVVIEWVENELRVIPIKGEYQLVTNFWLSNPKLGWYPCNRYDKAKEMLEEKKSLSVEFFAGILKATAQNWGDGGTKFSNIYNLKTRDVYVFNRGDFEKTIKINLEDELKNLKKDDILTYEIDGLFNNNANVSELKIANSVIITENPTDLVPKAKLGISFGVIIGLIIFLFIRKCLVK